MPSSSRAGRGPAAGYAKEMHLDVWLPHRLRRSGSLWRATRVQAQMSPQQALAQLHEPIPMARARPRRPFVLSSRPRAFGVLPHGSSARMSRRRRGCHMDSPSSARGGVAAATWIVRGRRVRVAVPPRLTVPRRAAAALPSSRCGRTVLRRGATAAARDPPSPRRSRRNRVDGRVAPTGSRESSFSDRSSQKSFPKRPRSAAPRLASTMVARTARRPRVHQDGAVLVQETTPEASRVFRKMRGDDEKHPWDFDGDILPDRLLNTADREAWELRALKCQTKKRDMQTSGALRCTVPSRGILRAVPEHSVDILAKFGVRSSGRYRAGNSSKRNGRPGR